SRLYPPLEDEHKLVEDKVTKRTNKKLENKRKALAKRKLYSADRNLNVLAVNLVRYKREPLDHMTPPEEERDGILQDIHKLGHFGVQELVKQVHVRGLHWTGLVDDCKR